MNVRLGTAPDSWGVWFPDDPKQPPWQRFLDEVVEAGYEWIELGPRGYLPTDVPSLRDELESRGLKVSATFVHGPLEDAAAWPELEKQVFATGELLATLGAGFLVLIPGGYTDPFTGAQIAPATLSERAWKQMIDATHRVANIALDRFGLRLVFHPHGEAYVETEEQIEAFLEQTDPATVSLCLDTGWHAYRGGDPVSFMRRHHDRTPYLHLKSVDKDVLGEVEAHKLSIATAVQRGVFCEPSEGVVDFLSFRDVLRDINFDGWAIVEQDMYPAPWDKPLPIAKRTRAYLREIGLG